MYIWLYEREELRLCHRFLCGLMVDIFFEDVIGLYALIYMYIGFFSGIFKKMFYSDHVFMPMILVFSNDFIYNMLCYLFRFVLRNKLDFSFYFGNIILPEMIITSFVTLILYKAFYLLNEKVLTLKQENTLSFDK
ncbi:MAG: rod shape-determining protein MreD [Eubacterium sp.]